MLMEYMEISVSQGASQGRSFLARAFDLARPGVVPPLVTQQKFGDIWSGNCFFTVLDVLPLLVVINCCFLHDFCSFIKIQSGCGPHLVGQQSHFVGDPLWSQWSDRSSGLASVRPRLWQTTLARLFWARWSLSNVPGNSLCKFVSCCQSFSCTFLR